MKEKRPPLKILWTLIILALALGIFIFFKPHIENNIRSNEIKKLTEQIKQERISLKAKGFYTELSSFIKPVANISDEQNGALDYKQAFDFIDGKQAIEEYALPSSIKNTILILNSSVNTDRINFNDSTISSYLQKFSKIFNSIQAGNSKKYYMWKAPFNITEPEQSSVILKYNSIRDAYLTRTICEINAGQYRKAEDTLIEFITFTLNLSKNQPLGDIPTNYIYVSQLNMSKSVPFLVNLLHKHYRPTSKLIDCIQLLIRNSSVNLLKMQTNFDTLLEIHRFKNTYSNQKEELISNYLILKNIGDNLDQQDTSDNPKVKVHELTYELINLQLLNLIAENKENDYISKIDKSNIFMNIMLPEKRDAENLALLRFNYIKVKEYTNSSFNVFTSLLKTLEKKQN